MLCQLESKEEASPMGRVGAKAPAVLARELRRTNEGQEILLLPQNPASLSLVCPGLWVETEFIPTSPSLLTSVHRPLCVSGTVASEDLQLAPAMLPLHLQEVAPSESRDGFTPSASAYPALLTTLICCCVTLQGEMETNMTSLLQ